MLHEEIQQPDFVAGQFRELGCDVVGYEVGAPRGGGRRMVFWDQDIGQVEDGVEGVAEGDDWMLLVREEGEKMGERRYNGMCQM